MIPESKSSRITVKEIAADLAVSEIFVYRLLLRRELPAIRLHTHWIITRRAYERWKDNCGMPESATAPADRAAPHNADRIQ